MTACQLEQVFPIKIGYYQVTQPSFSLSVDRSVEATQQRLVFRSTGYISRLHNSATVSFVSAFFHAASNSFCTAPTAAVFFCALRASIRPKSERPFLLLRSRSARNTCSASAGFPLRNSTPPNDSRTGKNQIGGSS